MTDQWPPEGHKSWYRITEGLGENGEATEFDFSLPAGFETVDLAAARVLRHGGPNEADMIFRSQLYAHIGAVTVAGGHAEAAMKRAILVFSRADEAVFASIERMNWTDLENKLRQIAQSEDSKVSGLTESLDWAAEHRIKGRRDDVIHAYWWDYAGCGPPTRTFSPRRHQLDDHRDDQGLGGGLSSDHDLRYELGRRNREVLAPSAARHSRRQ